MHGRGRAAGRRGHREGRGEALRGEGRGAVQGEDQVLFGPTRPTKFQGSQKGQVWQGDLVPSPVIFDAFWGYRREMVVEAG